MRARKKWCGQCGEGYYNSGAHYEACSGRPSAYQCGRCLRVSDRTGFCCGERMGPFYHGRKDATA